MSNVMILRRRWQILQMQCLVPIMALSVRLFGLQRTYRLLQKLLFPATPPADPRSVARQFLGALKQGMANSPWNGNCLSRSLALWWQLERHGVGSDFMIGVRHGERFRAHAWVELNGEILNAGKQVRRRYQVIEQLELQ